MKPSCIAAAVYAFAGLAAMTSIALAAFAAHGVAKVAPTGERAVLLFNQATDFQMKHALALILVMVIADRLDPGTPRTLLYAAVGLMVIGILLFSGALYAAAFEKPHFYAPWGGTAAMLGWLIFAVGAALSVRST